MIILIAYTARTAEDYAHKNRLQKGDYHILSRSNYLRGFRNLELRWLSGWEDRRDSREILNLLIELRLAGRIKKEVFVSRDNL